MGHAFLFSSKLNDKHVNELITLLKCIKEYIKNPSTKDIAEKHGQSLISFFPIKTFLCKL